MGKRNWGEQRTLHTNVKTARRRSNASVDWLKRQLNDPYVQLAKKEGYTSRAAYKLIEINEKYPFLLPGKTVIDLGAAPGSWTQVVTRITKGSHIIALDLQPMPVMEDVVIITGDLLEQETWEKLAQALHGKKADIILSDMAASACGDSHTDHLRIMGLCEAAYALAEEHLVSGGVFLTKILRGGTEKVFFDDLRRQFSTVKYIKPPASRKDSAEIYILAMGFAPTAI